jgi:heterodisulfide reductase subunit C
MIASIVFGVIFLAGFGFFGWNMWKIRYNVNLGRSVDRSDNKGERLKTMLLVAFGQKKMFARPIPALLHLAIYVAFVITQIELIEIIADGFTGKHRMFYEALGGFYTFVISFIEVLSVFALIATFAFFYRRNILRLARFKKPEMKGFPSLDANLILLGEFLLCMFIFMMNGADEALYNIGQSHVAEGASGSFGFAVSSITVGIFKGMDPATLHVIERIGWWGHISIVFAFLNYLPYSKHFHILLAFPNTYYSNLEKKGKFTNMESVTNEVKLMLDPNADPYAAPAAAADAEPVRFGAKDVTDLSWKNLLDAYTCTECGRCTSACPANITGKKLSPRKIMMDTRDRLVEVGENRRKHGKDYDDGKSLIGDYITEEEVWACTSCNACVQECPVNIDPLAIIIDLRRSLVMEESKMPGELAGMLTNIENNGAPWQFAQSNRGNWIHED